MSQSFKSLKNQSRPRRVLRHVMPTSPADSEGHICEEFESLGDAQGFSPGVLDPDSELDRVVMALALICNDLIDAFAVQQRMDRGWSEAPPPSPYEGARIGRQGWATRMIASITHEALNTLKVHHVLLTSNAKVVAVVDSLTTDNARAWNDLMALALKPRSDPSRRFFLLTRNKISYHYAETEALADGYRTAFAETGATASNRWAYVSAGESFDGKRFYFADAAVGAAAAAGFERAANDSATVTDIAASAFNAFFDFVLKFMRMRMTKSGSLQAD